MNKRTPLIAGNWKMYKDVPEAVHSAKRLKNQVSDVSGVDVMIAPPFTALFPVNEVLRGGAVAVGAQNLFWEAEGAFTGEISAAMLVSSGCRYVIIGHSERRAYFGEKDSDVNKKISAALKAGLFPIMCVGESEKQREDGQTFSVLDKQIKNGLESFLSRALQNLVIAYEPIWAIGTGKTASSSQAQEVHQFIRKRLTETFDKDLADGMRILYGGSVKPQNIAELMSMPDIDGALVGGASLDADTFSKIVHYKTS